MPEHLDQTTPTRRLGPSPWGWMILACVLVAASGVVRVSQERLFADAARAAEKPPFTLRDLPQSLNGEWQMEGEELELDDRTQQIAGCTEHMYRDYVDNHTGVVLRVLVAFGPAIQVFPHSPDVCFPAHGYKPRGETRRREVALKSSDPDSTATFNAMTFGRSGGGSEELVEVYYSYWHDDHWDPEAKQTKHRFQHRPAMFKVQVERTINPNETKAPSQSPIEEFIAALVPEINQRLNTHANDDRLSE